MISKTVHIDEADEKAVVKTYILDDYPKYFQQQKRPAVIICPGGGYTTLARKEGEPVALKINTMGYHAFVLNYSVIFSEKPKSFNDEKDLPDINPNAYFPVQLYQLQKAIKLLQDNADEWNIDTDQIVLMGFSAGGHLVASYITYGKELLKEKYIQPKAAALGYTRSNMMIDDWSEKFSTEAGRLITKYKYICQFKTEFPTEEQKLEIDPYSHIHKKMPPVFLWHSFTDISVKALSSLTFATKLFESGIPVEFHLFSTGVHGCALADRVCASEEKQYDEGCEKWIELFQIWLRKILKEESREKSLHMEEKHGR